MVKVEARRSKLLLFQNFFVILFFFTRAIPRGARAPKNVLMENSTECFERTGRFGYTLP